MKLIMLIGSGLFALGLFISHSSPEILIESLESKTANGSPVFNRIEFHPGWNEDVWLMKQAPSGLDGPWDELKIVVDKTKSPQEARFYQIGAPYKARCFSCHANGPRAIRINSDSEQVNVGLLDRLRIAVWNLRVKTYGHVNTVAGQPDEEEHPFRSPIPLLSQGLRIPTCEKCHSAGGIRNELKLEQVGSAQFLVKKGLMPPFPFQPTAEERRFLERL